MSVSGQNFYTAVEFIKMDTCSTEVLQKKFVAEKY